MPVSVSGKRPDGNATSPERPGKRAKLSATDSSKENETLAGTEVPDSDEDIGELHTSEDAGPSDLYLDTVSTTYQLLGLDCLTIIFQINRVILDFDFEKVCSVSLSNINIYGCLVCGKYFQGRGRHSYAYAHSVHDDHHVFINLETTKVDLFASIPWFNN